MVDARDRLTDLTAWRLQQVVRSALGEPGAVLGAWEAVTMKVGGGALAGTPSLMLLRGVARVGAVEKQWRVVLKVLARVAGHDDPAHIDYWKRECMLYGSGLLDALPAGLRAPRCYGCDEPAGDIAWIWLEHIPDDRPRRWRPAHWQRAGRHLGQFNGAYLAGRSLPHALWLGGRRLRLLRHGAARPARTR